jgi:hypothetical protein
MATKKSSSKKPSQKLKSKALNKVKPLAYKGHSPEVCYVAAVVFHEDFVTGPRVNLVRRWLYDEFAPSGRVPQLVMNLYTKHGKAAAKVIERSSILKAAFRKLFDRALAKAEAHYQA